jgi:hypothetical protein
VCFGVVTARSQQPETGCHALFALWDTLYKRRQRLLDYAPDTQLSSKSTFGNGKRGPSLKTKKEKEEQPRECLQVSMRIVRG